MSFIREPSLPPRPHIRFYGPHRLHPLCGLYPKSRCRCTHNPTRKDTDGGGHLAGGADGGLRDILWSRSSASIVPRIARGRGRSRRYIRSRSVTRTKRSLAGKLQNHDRKQGNYRRYCAWRVSDLLRSFPSGSVVG